MSTFDVSEIQEKRQRVWHGMKDILSAAVVEGRDNTPEELAEYDKRETELTALEAQLERVKKFNEREAGRNEVAVTQGVSRDEMDTAEKRYERAFVEYVKRGQYDLSPESRQILSGVELRGPLDPDSLSTLSPGPGTAGTTGYSAGYLIPQGFWMNLQIALKQYGGLLSHARVLQTDSGNPMPWPTVDPTSVVGYYLGEGSQTTFGGGQDSSGAGVDYEFGQGFLNAWTIVSGVILASQQILEDSAFDVDSFVTDRVGEAIGRKIAAELQTGSGTNAIQGIQTALVAKPSSGVGVGGVFTGASGTVPVLGSGTRTLPKLANGLVGFDDLVGMTTYVDPAYRDTGNAIWVASDTTLAGLRKVVDNYGHPLWDPSVQNGGPAGSHVVGNIYGFPVVVDQNVGSVATTASTAGGLLFGDFTRAMVVRQVNGSHFMRLNERYADYLQVGFLGYCRMDARSNDLRAAVVYSSPAA